MTSDQAGAWAILLVMFSSYFIPTFIACLRGHRQSVAIAVLNIFLGWTGLGWIVALIWSATNEPDRGGR